MQVFQVSVNGHGWLIKASSVTVAAKRGLYAFERAFPKASSIIRLRERGDRGADFNIHVELSTEAAYTERMAQKATPS